MITISVARDFSPFPAGRYTSDGDFSGERFREEVLRPRLATGDVVVVQLAGTKGYGSSFLEEAFGGLVRHGYFSREDLMARLKIEADAPQYAIYKRRAEDYIARASFGSAAMSRMAALGAA